MGRILAIDYGQKRVGLAVTDESRMIATALATVHVKDIIAFLKDYIPKEKVDIIVIGEPRDMNNQASASARFIEPFVKIVKKHFPDVVVDRMDERFTSQMAFQTMIDAGLGKKRRQDKELVDTISAAIILQSYLEMLTFREQREIKS